MLRVVALLCLILTVCWFAGCSPQKEESIIILQTGRQLGNVYPVELRSIAPLQNYPYLSAYVAGVRRQAAVEGKQVLLIDSGDSLAGSFAALATQHRNMVTLFNELSYDAIFLGNLDANMDEASLHQLKAPVLCPFVNEVGQPAMPGTKPGVCLHKGGIDVILLANFYGDLARHSAPERFPMWFGPSRGHVEPLRDYAAVLEGLKNGCKNPLVLFHWMKFEPSEKPPAAFVGSLQKLGVDAVLAHRIYNSARAEKWDAGDYHDWNLPVSANILRQNLGFTVARMELKKSGRRWISANPPEIVHMRSNTAESDPAIIGKINAYAAEIRQANEPVTKLDHSLSQKEVLRLFMESISRTTPCDMVFYSASSIRSEVVAGPLTAAPLFNALPWTVCIVSARLTQEQAGKVAQLPGFATLMRDPLPAGPVLVTSDYFARVLQEQTGLTPSQFHPVGNVSEFESFKEYVKKHGADCKQWPDNGRWIYGEL